MEYVDEPKLIPPEELGLEVKMKPESELQDSPKPQKKESAFLFFLIQLKPKVLYSKPHDFIVSNPSNNFGKVTQINKIQSFSAISFTGRFLISSLDITS